MGETLGASRVCNECQEKDKEIPGLLLKISKLEKTLNELQTNQDYMVNVLHDSVSSFQEVETYNDHSKKYSNKLKQCVYELLGLNVSARNVPVVIKAL